MYITPKALKATRIYLGLTLDQVGKAAGLSSKTVARVEAGGAKVSLEAVAAIQAAFERMGVHFLPQTEEFGEGMRMPRHEGSGFLRPAPREGSGGRKTSRGTR
jgi:transcriptional regulator with XRE-family HTH domain